jgi:hypothetical protein
MNTNYAKSIILILAFGIMIAGCKSSKVTEESKYIGEWHYTFEMEGTEYAAIMTINKAEDGYTGALSSEIGGVDLDNLVIEDDSLKATYDIQGYILELEGTFSGETFKGISTIEGYEFPMDATRKK